MSKRLKKKRLPRSTASLIPEGTALEKGDMWLSVKRKHHEPTKTLDIETLHSLRDKMSTPGICKVEGIIAGWAGPAAANVPIATSSDVTDHRTYFTTSIRYEVDPFVRYRVSRAFVQQLVRTYGWTWVDNGQEA